MTTSSNSRSHYPEDSSYSHGNSGSTSRRENVSGRDRSHHSSRGYSEVSFFKNSQT